MSVIVRLPNKQIRLYSKGADATMLARLSKDEDQKVPTYCRHLLTIFVLYSGTVSAVVVV